MTPHPVRVIKVGGSLLGPQTPGPGKGTFALLLSDWLAGQTPAINVLVAGGGEFVDAIGRADAAHHLGEETAHWLCVDALAVTAQLLGAVLSLPVVTRFQDLPDTLGSACIFDPAPFLHQVEHRLFSLPLPHTWSVTSDSIAARLAEYMSARELVLLKSRLPGKDAADYVDRSFSVAAANLPSVRCVNFRSPTLEETPWVRGS